MGLLDWWRNKPQRDEAIRLLQAEADSNLNLLEGWWRKYKPRKSEDEIHRVDKVVYARELTDTDLPEFSRQVYSRYQPSLSQYLRGAQLKDLGQFYQDLSKLEEIQQELRRALEKDLGLRQSPKGQPSSASQVPPTFDNFLKVAPWLWRDAALLVDQILTRGNPLGGKKP